ncbi:MAG: ATP-binding cassette domain-containing protein [Candidatus Lambdaproteobacteria bacterium]|nr:ATP-binding cassette domain-containing protein [Candidatus Lambdaproteobacteria bacterium]
MIGYNVFTAAPAWYIKDVVDTLEAGQVPGISRFVLIGLGIVLIFTAKGIFYYGQNYLMGIVGQRLIEALRARLYAHMSRLSFSFFTRTSTGELVTRFTSDLVNLQNAISLSISGPLRDIPQIFLLMAILVIRSWQLFLLSMILIPIAFWLISRFGSRTRLLTADRLSTFGQMTSLVVETIQGIRVVKAFGMEKYEQERFERANQELYRKNLKTIHVASYSTPLLEVIGAFAGGAIIMFGGFLIIQGYITAGDFVSFLLAFFMLNQPIRHMNGFMLKLQEGVAAAQRVFELLDTEPEVVDRPGAQTLEPFRGNIQMRVDRFGYKNAGEPALRDVDLTVKAGQVVALVGASGSGKTTLVNLIPRFFELSEGRITIDGQDIQHVTISSLRAQISIVTQEIFLFNDTIANNIAYGNITRPHATIVEAARAANAHDFIMRLPNGYETYIGEGGMELSGGQRQRIAIARALIKDAPILILDEATSALDSESEREVQEAIENLVKNRTTLVIAHRLSTVRKADRIYVLDKGRVVEQGQHRELLRRGGQYKRLYEMQFRDAIFPEQSQFPWQRWWNRLLEREAESVSERN